MKIKVLFMCDGIALSHFVRSMFLIKCLERDKYVIVLAASPKYRHRVLGRVDRFIELPSLTEKEFEKRNDTIDCKHIYDKKVLKLYIKSDLRIINEINPDIIVGDLRVSLGITAKISGIPFFNIQNAHWSTQSLINVAMPEIKKLWFMSYKKQLKVFPEQLPKLQNNFISAYNFYCEKYKLPKINTFQEFFTSGDINLYVDTPLISPVDKLLDGHYYIGPVLDFVNCKLPEWWTEINTNKKIVYCSIGSTGNVSKMLKISKALQSLDVTVIMVTAGKVSKKIFPHNFYVCNYIPAIRAIERSDIIIYNGGSGTLYQALSKGKPVLSLPTSMDQFMSSSQVESLNIGKVLRTNSIQIPKLVKVVEELLNNNIYKENAEKVMKEINQYDIKKRFIEVFEQQLECRQLIKR